LIDNDDGAKDIFPFVKSKTKIDISLTSTSIFYHFDHNLYLIKTPEIGANGTSCIEDLFDKSVRDTKIDGKIFNPSPKIDPTKEFGKIVFAEKIVAPNKDKIDFSKFSPIFDRIVAVVEHYKAPAIGAKPT
jgi:RNA-directed DNA polymerase